ncbi:MULTISPECIES: hypothetical protein [unclassified Streptomyces]|uniref:hypothetical protein n=1 Tax=unclassified Streptomyces TaxID=2593676 RepID=UPI002E18D32B|nr:MULTISPECIES: hypothetical protein [unclassified Streptomyces]
MRSAPVAAAMLRIATTGCDSSRRRTPGVPRKSTLKIPESAKRGPRGTLAHARELGLEGVFFRSVLGLSPTLDPVELRTVRARADDMGMYLETGLGKVNPFAIPGGSRAAGRGGR